MSKKSFRFQGWIPVLQEKFDQGTTASSEAQAKFIIQTRLCARYRRTSLRIEWGSVKIESLAERAVLLPATRPRTVRRRPISTSPSLFE